MPHFKPLPRECHICREPKVSPVCSNCGMDDTKEGLGVELRHTMMVNTLVKSGEEILASLTPEKCHLWHMATGIDGEAGELSDAVKKHVVYCKAIDRAHIIEEMGDLEFYLKGAREALGITREEVLEHNLAKLAKRYGESYQYSDAAAQNRADKV
jgi:NTP pyrophosphatase (non-canonical NTP hydrolase)